MSQRRRSRIERVVLVHVGAAAWGAAMIGLGFVPAIDVPIAVAAATGGLCIGLAVTGLLTRSWLLSVYGALIVTSLGAVAAGAVIPDGVIGSTGLLGLIVSGAAAALSWQVDRVRAALAPDAAPATTASERAERILQKIHDHVLLSDAAKRVLFRDRELQLLRQAIEEQISVGDYDVAATLCDDMAELFGRREEAEQFRERILLVRQERDEARIMTSVARLDEYLAVRNWSQAHQEAARLKRLYPESHLLQGVDERIARAREEHKHDLVQQFLDAAERDDTESAMRLLQELDRYMTRQEAERLSSVAERVVTRRRDALGQAFKLAVNEHRWADAVRAGESIVAEFPRSRMCQEVLAMIDTIRTRAGGTAVPTEERG